MGEHWTIYSHTHTASGRQYVGLTKKTLLQRWNQHIYTSGKATKRGWSYFANAIRKYGKDAFSHETLEICDTLEAANLAEKRWIEKLDTMDPTKGFNVMPGGERVHIFGKKNPWQRPEFRAKMEATAIPRLIAAGSSLSSRAASKATLATPEGKAALSRGVSRHYEDPINRARQSESVKALHRDPKVHASFQKGLQAVCARKRARTHCKNGHEFTFENTGTTCVGGWRRCRRCDADRVSKKAASERTSCLNGHPYANGTFKMSRSRHRVCLLCVATHCKLGHALVPGNVVIVHVAGRPARVCLECRRARGRVSDAGRRARKRAVRIAQDSD